MLDCSLTEFLDFAKPYISDVALERYVTHSIVHHVLTNVDGGCDAQ